MTNDTVTLVKCSECSAKAYGNADTLGKECPANFKCSGTLKKVRELNT